MLSANSSRLGVWRSSTSRCNYLISGLGGHVAPALGAFDLFITYNPTAISFTRAAFGDPLHGDQLSFVFPSITQVPRTNPGLVHIVELSLDDQVTLDTQQLDSFTLATLTFVTSDFPAISDLTILNDQLHPALLVDAAGKAISAFSISAGRVNTTSAPPTLALVLIAMTAILCVRVLGSRRPVEPLTPGKVVDRSAIVLAGCLGSCDSRHTAAAARGPAAVRIEVVIPPRTAPGR